MTASELLARTGLKYGPLKARDLEAWMTSEGLAELVDGKLAPTARARGHRRAPRRPSRRRGSTRPPDRLARFGPSESRHEADGNEGPPTCLAQGGQTMRPSLRATRADPKGSKEGWDRWTSRASSTPTSTTLPDRDGRPRRHGGRPDLAAGVHSVSRPGGAGEVACRERTTRGGRSRRVAVAGSRHRVTERGRPAGAGFSSLR